MRLDFLIYAQAFPGYWQGPFSSLPSCKVVWSPPPASRLPVPSALASQGQDKASGSGWEGSWRRERGMGKAAQRNSSPKPPGRQRWEESSRSARLCSLSASHHGWAQALRAAAGLQRGPTDLPVGGNSDTCLTSEAEPRTARGRRQTTGEELGSRAALSKGVRAREGWGPRVGTGGQDRLQRAAVGPGGGQWSCQASSLGLFRPSRSWFHPPVSSWREAGLWKAV